MTMAERDNVIEKMAKKNVLTWSSEYGKSLYECKKGRRNNKQN